jgi:hemoglobin
MIRRAAHVVFMVLLLNLPGLILAQTPPQPLAPKDIDVRLDNQLYETLKIGTILYNSGNAESCFRLYQGSLISSLGFLDHRPDQQVKVQKALKDIEGMTNMSQRAHALRTAIDELRASFRPPITLWDRLGGESAVTALVEDLVSRVTTDPRINFARRGSPRPWDSNPNSLALVKKRLVGWISSVTGGPLKYDGRDMRSAHGGMKISDAEFTAFANALKSSMARANLPAKEQGELLALMTAPRQEIVDPPNMPIPPSAPPAIRGSLWDRIGGEPAVSAIVDELIKRAASNPKINFTRLGTPTAWETNPKNVAQLKQRLIQFISSVTGGPLKYEGQDMKTVHKSMKISAAEFDALTGDLKLILDRARVPFFEKEELLQVVAGLKRDIVDPAASGKSLWDRLGGESVVANVVDALVSRAAANPKVNFTRKGLPTEWQTTPENVAKLKSGLVQYLSSITGGPYKYAGKDMKAAHQGMKITDAEFSALATDLKLTLEAFKIPIAEQNELMTLIHQIKADVVEKK